MDAKAADNASQAGGLARPAQQDFVCGLCQRNISMRWNYGKGPSLIIPPICPYCEGQYTNGVGRPQHGAHRDRREAMRLYAAAEALLGEASRQQWSHQYG